MANIIRRISLLSLLLLIPVGLFAQMTRVKGSVVDAENGEPIPFASVYFDGTTIGISTDLEGAFSMETRSKDAKVLTAHIIGYLPQSFSVVNGSFSEVHFRLEKDVNQLNAAMVKPDNRYIRSILAKIDDNRKRHNPELGEPWETSLYSKIELDVTNAEDIIGDTFLRKRLGFLLDYRDTSAVTGKPYLPMMISENYSRKYHSLDPAFDRELMLASRISGLEQDNLLRQFTGSYLLKTNFYDSSIHVFNLDMPSPASGAGHLFYNYFLVDSLQVDGRKTYTIRFHPKALVTSPVLDGEMNIDAEEWAIRSVHASLASKSNVNWIRHINVDIENQRLDNGKWFYKDEGLFIDFSISVSDSSKIVSFLGNRHLSYSDAVFGPIEDPVVLKGNNPVIYAENPEKDEAYWEEVRPYELTERERGIFRMVNELTETTAYKTIFALSHMLSIGYLEHPDHGMVGYGPWAKTVTFNSLEGLHLQAGFRTTKYLSQFIRVGGALGYGFKDKAFKYTADVEMMFNREKTSKLSLHASQDYAQLSSGAGVFTENNIFNSLLARAGTDKVSLLREFYVAWDQEFCNNFNSILLLQSRRIFGNDMVPLLRPDGTFQDHITANQIHWNARFSWQERVSRNVFHKSYLFTRYPVITLDLVAGIKGITKDDFSFYRGELTVDWNIPAGAAGFGKLHVNGGAILGSVPYNFLKLHEGNQTYFLDRTAFSCMNYFEFASDRWVTGFYEHNLNGFILGKIPLINKLDLREIFTVRGAWGIISEQNLNGPFVFPVDFGSINTPYVEVGAGISNIFRLLRVDFFWRLTHRTETSRNFVVNVGLDMEF